MDNLPTTANDAPPAPTPVAHPSLPARSLPTTLPIPPLPAAAALDPTLGASAAPWLDAYVARSAAVCPMLPSMFHESAALWLASVAVARRLYVSTPAGPVYPNLFVAWIAPNVLYETGSAYILVRDLAERAFPGLIAPAHMTPINLLHLFADCLGPGPYDWQRSRFAYSDSGQDASFPAQRGWLPGDLGRLLPESRRSFHRSGLGLLVDLYGCPPRFHHADRGTGFLTASDTYLSLLAYTTPIAVAASLADRSLWDLGWWSSFAFIVPDLSPRDWREPSLAPETPALLETVVRLYKSLLGSGEPKRYRPCEVALEPTAAEAWTRYRRALVHDLRAPDLNSRLRVAYCQLPLQLVKVATLLAALDWAAALPPDASPVQRPASPVRRRARDQEAASPPTEPFRAPAITLAHLARAQSIVEVWRANLHRALEAELTTTSAGLDARILRQVESHGAAGATPPRCLPRPGRSPVQGSRRSPEPVARPRLRRDRPRPGPTRPRPPHHVLPYCPMTTPAQRRSLRRPASVLSHSSPRSALPKMSDLSERSDLSTHPPAPSDLSEWSDRSASSARSVLSERSDQTQYRHSVILSKQKNAPHQGERCRNNQWTRPDSNRRSSPCKGDAFPLGHGPGPSYDHSPSATRAVKSDPLTISG